MDGGKIILVNPKEIFSRFLYDYDKKIRPLSWDDKNSEWTKKILGYFIDLGESLGYNVYTDPRVRNGYYEYLVDLCWAIELKDDYPNEWGIELAIEQEWSTELKEIYYDFEKLLDIKANLKIMICSPRIKDIDDILLTFQKYVSKCMIKIPTERYLIIIFTKDINRKESERIKIEGYEIDYLGNIKELGYKRFPEF